MNSICVRRMIGGAMLLVLQVLQAHTTFAQQTATPGKSSAVITTRENYLGDEACRACHSGEVRSYLSTGHHLTSQLPTKESILGSFAEDKNILKTSDPALFFRMESRPDGFYQTAVWGIPPATVSRAEKMDVIIGSGRRGQTYLYWKRDQLYQLPVSYWTDLSTWINSPNYQDGEANFEKRVLPNCLACHLTYAASVGSPVYSNQFKRETFVLGISCERCHGPGQKHVDAMTAKKPDANIINTAKLNRDRQIDLCAQCHGGLRPLLADPFSYVPGEPLDKYYRANNSGPAGTADVHGNQVGLLQMSRCYQSSPDMTCSTCHDVHQNQRNLTAFAERCMKCHRAEACGEYAKSQAEIIGKCVNCHMPVQASNVIVSSLNGKQTKALVRSHWIKIYSGSSHDSKPSYR